MDRVKQDIHTVEFPTNVDVLREKQHVRCDIPEGLVRQVPPLSPGEQVCLFGVTERKGPGPLVLRIQSVAFDLPATEDESGTRTGLHGLNIADPVTLRERAQVYKEAHPDLGRTIFLGEIRSTTLTEADVDILKTAYGDGDFKPYQPCIIGVLKPDSEGKQKLTFSRLVRVSGNNSFKFEEVSRL